MPRDKNTVSTAKVHLSTTPQVLSSLDALVKTGLFGKTRTEVAEELLRLKVREAVAEGWVERAGQGPAPAPAARARARRRGRPGSRASKG
jgi:hypothetical protein